METNPIVVLTNVFHCGVDNRRIIVILSLLLPPRDDVCVSCKGNVEHRCSSSAVVGIQRRVFPGRVRVQISRLGEEGNSV